jgi:GMP synthase-like glutamine amidotransferase
MPSRPILVIENDPTDPVARLGDWLRAAGAELHIRQGFAGDEIPTAVEDYSAVVVMGGAQNAYDDEAAPWLPAVRSLLSAATRAGLPTLGVCLGGQLLAVATGGQVGRAETPEYGSQLVAKRQAAASDPLFGDLPITPDVLQWHVDAVTRLPAGAELLASSPACEVQAFRIGRAGWGLQFHIETTPDIVRTWAAEDAEALAEYDVDRILDRTAAAHPDIAEAWQPFAAAFVGVAADPDLLGPSGPQLLPLAGSRSVVAEPITDPAAIRAALAAEMQAARGPHGH